MNQHVKSLKHLYNQTSKHSNYQILPECLKPFLSSEEIQVKTRYEKERLAYILQHIDPINKSILDIGGNSGYFSFELIERGSGHIDYYEGNAVHAEFVSVASTLLNFSQNLTVHSQYFDFNKNDVPNYDITLLLNVLHHVGDDYENKNLSISKAKQKIIESLNMMANRTATLIFQLGFCWKGDRKLLLFEKGTKKEMIDFVADGTQNFWEMTQIGIPILINEKVSYEIPNGKNLIRNNSIGEFLNRPIFILKSKKQ